MTKNYTHMILAGNEKGVSEIRGSVHEQRIIEYHQSTSLRATSDEVPWCASFVGWVLAKTGFTPTKSAMARSYLKWGIPTSGQVGDVVVFWRKSPKSSSGHVAFMVKKGMFKIHCLGGNQNNKVCIKKYWRFMVLGYRRPQEGWVNG